MMCRFCDVVEGRSEAFVVFDTVSSLAFLDARPLFAGHTLVVPKAHYEGLADLPAETARRFVLDLQIVVRGVETATSAEGSFTAINHRVSQSVPHLHVHVVPRRHKDGLRGFFWPRQAHPDPREMRAVQQRIQEAIVALFQGPEPGAGA